MIRPLLRTAIWLTLLFIVVTVLIRSQPYDDSALRTFLDSSGCAMPCFMGIRPGITTCNEAVAILEAHQWVRDFQLNECPTRFSSKIIVWTWNGQQPSFLMADSRPSPSILVDDGVVSEITIKTHIRLGDLWLLYGRPTHGIVDVIGIPGGSGYVTQILNGNVYPEIGLTIASYTPCPTSFETLWNAPTGLLFSSKLQSRPMTMEKFAYLLQYHNRLCRN